MKEIFACGISNLKNNLTPGRHCTSTSVEKDEVVKTLILENRAITIREVTEEVGTSVGEYHAFFRMFWA